MLQHTIAYSCKLFSCIVTNRMSVIEFSATKMMSQLSLWLRPHTHTGALCLCPWTPLCDFRPPKPLGFAPFTLATPMLAGSMLCDIIYTNTSVLCALLKIYTTIPFQAHGNEIANHSLSVQCPRNVRGVNINASYN